jgi:hypothetical protein
MQQGANEAGDIIGSFGTGCHEVPWLLQERQLVQPKLCMEHGLGALGSRREDVGPFAASTWSCGHHTVPRGQVQPRDGLGSSLGIHSDSDH